jgi:hypothetical protein
MFKDLGDNSTNFVKDFVLSSVSKSFMNRFDSCPREAYLSKRDKNPQTNKKEPTVLKRGKEAHRKFAFIMAKYWSDNGGPDGVLDYVPCENDPMAAYLAEKAVERINPESLVDGGSILGIEMSLNSRFSCNKSASGIVDLAILKEHPEYGAYVHIIDFKTSFKVSSEADTEELFYIFLGLKTFDLPVQFSRISGHSGSFYHSNLYFTEELKALDVSLSANVTYISRIMESEETPLPKISSRCSSCDYTENCGEYNVEPTLEETLAAKKIAEQKVKDYTEKIKTLQQSTGGLAKSEHFVIHPKRSISYGLVPGQRLKKEHVIRAALDIGLYDLYPEIFDIKLHKKAAKMLEECSEIKFRENIRATIGISDLVTAEDEFELNIDSIPSIEDAIDSKSKAEKADKDNS